MSEEGESYSAHIDAFKAALASSTAYSGLFGLPAAMATPAPSHAVNAYLVNQHMANMQYLGQQRRAMIHQHMIGFVSSLPAQSISSSFSPLSAAPAPTPNFLKPDPKQPDTLGWREWAWNDQQKCLMSPSQGTLWPTAEHTAHHWSNEDAVRGHAGIHAMLVPRHWKILKEFEVSIGYGGSITGIVERYGKYVMGTEGWRAEQVVIRELLAPSTEIGLELEQRYPDVIVHYSDQGEEPCKSEKLSGLVKGNRSPLPSLVPIPPLPSLPTLQQAQQIVQSSPPGRLTQYQPERIPLLRGLAALWLGVAGCWVAIGLAWLSR